MSRIIKDQSIVDDSWTLLKLAEDETPETVALPTGAIIVPLAVWQARRPELEQRTALAVWLDAHEDPAAIAGDLAHFALVAVNFPKFTDGRGFSTARLLRERYGYTGELRAVGDVLHDQLFFMRRCGFNAYALREDKNIDKALELAFRVFSDSYQTAVDQKLPHYRRSAA